MRVAQKLAQVGTGLVGILTAGSAFAQEGLQGLETVGKPTPKAMGFQPAATELAERLQFLDGMLLWISAIITVFVTALLIWVIIRYNSKTNKVPATFTHNSTLEVAWTVIPIVILIFIGAFSLPLLFYQMEIPKADVTIKITGNQWYWSYEYPDSEFEFDSYLVDASTEVASLGPDQPYGTPQIMSDITVMKLEALGYAKDEFLLATDTAVVVPVNANVVLQITGSDVIHSWAMPAFGVKLDAVPGRLAETWFNANREGIYFGQCSELCGKDHAYMPITVKVVSQEVYDAWLTGAIAEYAGTPAPVAVASN